LINKNNNINDFLSNEWISSQADYTQNT